ncbi:MAG: replicative DNA helicase [Bacilli bacterium]|nr:replicative DNA helicase [Bacilli bacterium]
MPTKKNQADLPYNSTAEKAVLGSAMVSNSALYNVLSSLEESDFFEAKHQLIYRAILSLFNRNTPVDVLTVTEELTNMKELEVAGGVNYLQTCTESVVSISALESYVDIVLNQSVLRKLILSVRDINDSYLSEDIDDVNDFILRSQEKIANAVARAKVDTFKTSKTVAETVEKEIYAAKNNNNGSLVGIPSGYPKLDAITQGFQKSGMYIVAARPNVGKTALALNFAFNAARDYHIPVAIFSLEMDAELLIKRLIGVASNVNLTNVSSGNIMGNDRMKVSSAIKEISNCNIYIDDSSNLKLMDIIAKARKLQASVPDLGMIIIDYLGLVQTATNGKNPDSRQEEVRKISLALKGLARELKLPVIVVSQLSRDVEKRGDNKRPMLSDLRDSGNIEQDADLVMLLYREDYYKGQKGGVSSQNKKVKDMTDSEKFEVIKSMNPKNENDPTANISYVEINVAKNRNGSTGQCGLFFYRSFGRFDSPSEEWERQIRELNDEMNSK